MLQHAQNVPDRAGQLVVGFLAGDPQGGVKPHSGKFKPITAVAPGRRRQEEVRRSSGCRVLLTTFCETPGRPVPAARGGKVALETGGLWGYCERCRYTQRPFPGTTGA